MINVNVNLINRILFILHIGFLLVISTVKQFTNFC